MSPSLALPQGQDTRSPSVAEGDSPWKGFRQSTSPDLELVLPQVLSDGLPAPTFTVQVPRAPAPPHCPRPPSHASRCFPSHSHPARPANTPRVWQVVDLYADGRMGRHGASRPCADMNGGILHFLSLQLTTYLHTYSHLHPSPRRCKDSSVSTPVCASVHHLEQKQHFTTSLKLTDLQ